MRDMTEEGRGRQVREPEMRVERDDEAKARIKDCREQAELVEAVLRRMERGFLPSDLDGMVVRRLVRLLVEEWV